MSPTPPSILIIEDDPILSRLYRSKFELEGYEVEVADNGRSAFFRLLERPFNVLLLDLLLPQLNGLAFLKKIRAQKWFEKLPVVVFTNVYLGHLAQEALEAGANGVFFKASSTPKQLIAAVNELLGRPAASTTPTAPAQSSPFSATLPRNAAGRSAEPEAQAVVDSEIRAAYMRNVPTLIAAVKGLVAALQPGDIEANQANLLQEIHRRVHAFTGNMGLAGLPPVSQVGAAYEALLQELLETPAYLNNSTLHTLARTVDFLGVLLRQEPGNRPFDLSQVKILTVDDETISLRAMTMAMEKVDLKSVSVEDPQMAFRLLETNPFDLVITDVRMPGLTGFELWAKLRVLPHNQGTRVIFVTGLRDFERYATSGVGSGNDLIAKPFLLIELAVKALTALFQRQLH